MIIVIDVKGPRLRSGVRPDAKLYTVRTSLFFLWIASEETLTRIVLMLYTSVAVRQICALPMGVLFFLFIRS